MKKTLILFFNLRKILFFSLLLIVSNANSQSKDKIIQHFNSKSKQGESIYRNYSGERIKFYFLDFSPIFEFGKVDDRKVTKTLNKIGKVNLGSDIFNKSLPEFLYYTIYGYDTVYGYDRYNDNVIINESDLPNLIKIKKTDIALGLAFGYANAHAFSADEINPSDIYIKYPECVTEVLELFQLMNPANCDGFFTIACKTKKTRCENAIKLGQIFLNSRNNTINNSDFQIKADIIKNSIYTSSNRRSPLETLKLYPNYREFIKTQYRNWCESNTDALCPEYLSAFPEMIEDREISKLMERRGEVIKQFNETWKNIGKTSSSSNNPSSSSTSDNDKKQESSKSSNESDFDKCERINVPSVKKVGERGVSGFSYTYLIEFSDGIYGTLYLGDPSNKYFISDGLKNYYYKSYSSAVNALYRYKKCEFISKIDRD